MQPQVGYYCEDLR